MSLFLFRFWPALLPLLVYWLWFLRARRLAQKKGETLPKFRDGPWYRIVLASFAVAFICFLAMGLQAKRTKGEYTPPHMENGQLVPGEVTP